MFIGSDDKVIRHSHARHNAGQIFRNLSLIASFKDEEANRLRQKGDQKNSDNDRYRAADEKYRLPAELADNGGRNPAGNGPAGGKTAKNRHDRGNSPSPPHGFRGQG